LVLKCSNPFFQVLV